MVYIDFSIDLNFFTELSGQQIEQAASATNLASLSDYNEQSHAQSTPTRQE